MYICNHRRNGKEPQFMQRATAGLLRIGMQRIKGGVVIIEKVVTICKKYGYQHCDKCPLQAVCVIEHQRLPGATIEDKEKLWMQLMNTTAEAVKYES